MTEEEKKAIVYWKERLKDYKKEIVERQNDEFKGYGTLEDIAKLNYCTLHTLLNLIQKQQEKIKNKDKIIDELEYIFYNYQLCEYEITDCTYRKCEYIADDETPPCKQCIIEYFKKKVED